MRTIQGYKNELKNILSAIKNEEAFLQTGERLGTWHNPNERIKKLTKEAEKVKATLTKFTTNETTP